jgi:hypothetical protein
MIEDNVVKENGSTVKENGSTVKENGSTVKEKGSIVEEDVSVDTGLRFFPEGLETVVFLSERDCIVPSKRIESVLQGGTKVYVMPKLDHGGFLFCEYWMDMVLQTLVEMGSKT